MNLRREQLVRAARMRADGARKLLGSQSGGSPQVACYLLQVALECALKLRILHKNNVNDIESLKRRMPPNVFTRLFQSGSGHSISLLAENAGLRRFLVANNKEELIEGDAWGRITREERPYSLRYGVENVSREHASDELEVGDSVVRLLVEESP